MVRTTVLDSSLLDRQIAYRRYTAVMATRARTVSLWVISTLSTLAIACSGQVLQNPKANTAAAAGVAAATAAAITLAVPDFAAQRAASAEQAGRPTERGPAPSGRRETAPADVLDRLDEAESNARPTRAPVEQPRAATPR